MINNGDERIQEKKLKHLEIEGGTFQEFQTCRMYYEIFRTMNDIAIS